jgi:hypothetical protein
MHLKFYNYTGFNFFGAENNRVGFVNHQRTSRGHVCSF